MESKKKGIAIFTKLSLAVAIIVFCLILGYGKWETFRFSMEVNEITNLDSYLGYDFFYGYNAMLMSRNYRFIGLGDEASAKAELFSNIGEYCGVIMTQVFCYQALYALFITALASFFLWGKWKQKKIPIMPLVASVLFLILTIPDWVIWPLAAKTKLMITSQELVGMLAAVLGMLAGAMFIQMLYSGVKYKVVVYVLAIVMIIPSYFGGMFGKYRLYSDETRKSYDYLYEIDDRFGDMEYDYLAEFDENDNLTFDGVPYEPEIVPNEDHAMGAWRVYYVVIEAINPASAITANIVADDLYHNQMLMCIVSLMQGTIWLVICFCGTVFFVKKNSLKEVEQAEEVEVKVDAAEVEEAKVEATEVKEALVEIKEETTEVEADTE